MSDGYDDYGDYFGRPDKDGYLLVRVKRPWVPEWLWWMVAHVDPSGEWVAQWLTVPARQD